jgi:hypothetical protein
VVCKEAVAYPHARRSTGKRWLTNLRDLPDTESPSEFLLAFSSTNIIRVQRAQVQKQEVLN